MDKYDWRASLAHAHKNAFSIAVNNSLNIDSGNLKEGLSVALSGEQVCESWSREMKNKLHELIEINDIEGLQTALNSSSNSFIS
ncbi:hypothetical protein CBW58_05840 [Yersinia frederiksenii]|uniref:hypothetical protein n=1 Tax=Yersinia frederiksenii TaxID=29484 RepID=UPI0005E87B86|nr:hypothetical protein [Yersinia frederiksenii]OVZ93597.1 hypothetical protein CBW58_05840 [Yersinia frederiksenii]CFQ99186.1 Uncharacterised protein [Yersinia frederiksenii]